MRLQGKSGQGRTTLLIVALLLVVAIVAVAYQLLYR